MKANSALLRTRRRQRIRARILGTAERPRCAVFRSNKHFYAQLINDQAATTILGVNDKSLGASTAKVKPLERASLLGKYLADQALQKGVKSIVLDRGGYRYHGRVKALAEAARQAGLKF